MIRNVVFDLGRVLVEFDPAAYIGTFGFPEETARALYGIVFGADWNLHDRGDYERIEDLRDALCRRHPAYAAEISAVLTGDWVKIHYLKADTAAYLEALKARGYRIYILSNLSAESYEFISKYPFFRMIDGGVFSYMERACKPEEKIYRALLDRYALRPEETVFLDDNPDNIAAAARFGITGIVFSDILTAKAKTEAAIARAMNS